MQHLNQASHPKFYNDAIFTVYHEIIDCCSLTVLRRRGFLFAEMAGSDDLLSSLLRCQRGSVRRTSDDSYSFCVEYFARLTSGQDLFCASRRCASRSRNSSLSRLHCSSHEREKKKLFLLLHSSLHLPGKSFIPLSMFPLSRCRRICLFGAGVCRGSRGRGWFVLLRSLWTSVLFAIVIYLHRI
jgi:hypothetical protein